MLYLFISQALSLISLLLHETEGESQTDHKTILLPLMTINTLELFGYSFSRYL